MDNAKETFCRLCLNVMNFNQCFDLNSNNNRKIYEAVRGLFPTMKLDLMKSLISLCLPCVQKVELAFSFKKKISFNDNVLQSKVSATDTKNICRLCLKEQTSSDGIVIYLYENTSYSYELLRTMTEICTGQLDFDLLKKPIMCTHCWSKVKEIYMFKRNCFTNEKRLVLLSNNFTRDEIVSILSLEKTLTLQNPPTNNTETHSFNTSIFENLNNLKQCIDNIVKKSGNSESLKTFNSKPNLANKDGILFEEIDGSESRNSDQTGKPCDRDTPSRYSENSISDGDSESVKIESQENDDDILEINLNNICILTLRDKSAIEKSNLTETDNTFTSCNTEELSEIIRVEKEIKDSVLELAGQEKQIRDFVFGPSGQEVVRDEIIIKEETLRESEPSPEEFVNCENSSGSHQAPSRNDLVSHQFEQLSNDVHQSDVISNRKRTESLFTSTLTIRLTRLKLSPTIIRKETEIPSFTTEKVLIEHEKVKHRGQALSRNDLVSHQSQQLSNDVHQSDVISNRKRTESLFKRTLTIRLTKLNLTPTMIRKKIDIPSFTTEEILIEHEKAKHRMNHPQRSRQIKRFSSAESSSCSRSKPQVSKQNKNLSKVKDRSQKVDQQATTLYQCYHCKHQTTYRDKFVKHIYYFHKTVKNRTHFCNICEQQCKDLTTHMMKHTKEVTINSCHQKFFCNICQKNFKYLGLLRSHLFVHCRDSNSVCNICGKSFRSRLHLKRHKVIHSENRKVSCDLCQKSFSDTRKLDYHVKHVHYYCKVSCEICKKRFKDQRSVDLHKKRAHVEGEKHSCDMCPKTFPRVVLLLNHKKFVHRDENVSCDICKKHFKNKPKLQRHITDVHCDKNFSCDTCHKTFKRKEHLKLHIQVVHYAVRDFVCEVCSKRFKSRKNLQEHTKLHADTDAYVCEICKKGFKRRDSLKSHITIIHCEDRKFECSICQERFKIRGYLTRHMDVHLKKIRCKYCRKSFTKRAYVRKHEVSVHHTQ